MDFRAQASSFGAAADLYDRIRPRYPAAAIRWALGDAPLRVLDLGAGTGILTRQLVEAGHDVVAVEPDDRMRQQIAVAPALPGTAEQVPLPDADVDAVTAGQSYHWFPTDAAHAEIARVLRPGGVFAPIWNVRDDAEPWVAALSRIVEPHQRDVFQERSITREQFAPYLGPVERELFPWTARHTVDSLVELVKSRSYFIVAGAQPRARIEHDVRELLATHPGVAGQAEFDLPYVTYAFRAVRP